MPRSQTLWPCAAEVAQRSHPATKYVIAAIENRPAIISRPTWIMAPSKSRALHNAKKTPAGRVVGLGGASASRGPLELLKHFRNAPEVTGVPPRTQILGLTSASDVLIRRGLEHRLARHRAMRLGQSRRTRMLGPHGPRDIGAKIALRLWAGVFPGLTRRHGALTCHGPPRSTTTSIPPAP